MQDRSLADTRTIALPRNRRRNTEVLIGRLLWAGLFAVVLFLGA